MRNLLSVAVLLAPAIAFGDWSIYRATSCQTYTAADLSTGAFINATTDTVLGPSTRTFGYCPILLPDNAQIQDVSVYGVDQIAGASIDFALRRSGSMICDEPYDELIAWSSTDNEGKDCDAGWVGTPVAPINVANSSHAYWLYFEMPPVGAPIDLRFWSFEVRYL